MKIKLEHIVIFGLFIYIVFIQTCNSVKDPIEVIKTVEVFRTDSIHTRDTVKQVLRVPVASTPLIPYVYINDTLKSFKYAKKDSLLSYEITVESEHKPQDVKIKYDLTLLTITDSIFIRDSTHVKENIKKSFLSFGGQISGNNNSFGFAPSLFYHHKSGSNFGAGYDVVNGNLQLTYTKRISFKK